MTDLPAPGSASSCDRSSFTRSTTRRSSSSAACAPGTESGFLDSANAWLWTLRDGRVFAVKVFADPGEARRAFGDLLAAEPLQSFAAANR